MTKTMVLGGWMFLGCGRSAPKVPGITNTEVGYTGGHTPDPTYNTVKNGKRATPRPSRSNTIRQKSPSRKS